MTTPDPDLLDEADNLEADWEKKLEEATGDGGGCAEMFEALAEIRDDGEET